MQGDKQEASKVGGDPSIKRQTRLYGTGEGSLRESGSAAGSPHALPLDLSRHTTSLRLILPFVCEVVVCLTAVFPTLFPHTRLLVLAMSFFRGSQMLSWEMLSHCQWGACCTPWCARELRTS
jgi:hypothetical protein